eukprot:tig00000042_g15525.t1
MEPAARMTPGKAYRVLFWFDVPYNVAGTAGSVPMPLVCAETYEETPARGGEWGPCFWAYGVPMESVRKLVAAVAAAAGRAETTDPSEEVFLPAESESGTLRWVEFAADACPTTADERDELCLRCGGIGPKFVRWARDRFAPRVRFRLYPRQGLHQRFVRLPCFPYVLEALPERTSACLDVNAVRELLEALLDVYPFLASRIAGEQVRREGLEGSLDRPALDSFTGERLPSALAARAAATLRAFRLGPRYEAGDPEAGAGPFEFACTLSNGTSLLVKVEAEAPTPAQRENLRNVLARPKHHGALGAIVYPHNEGDYFGYRLHVMRRDGKGRVVEEPAPCVFDLCGEEACGWANGIRRAPEPGAAAAAGAARFLPGTSACAGAHMGAARVSPRAAAIAAVAWGHVVRSAPAPAPAPILIPAPAPAPASAPPAPSRPTRSAVRIRRPGGPAPAPAPS